MVVTITSAAKEATWRQQQFKQNDTGSNGLPIELSTAAAVPASAYTQREKERLTTAKKEDDKDTNSKRRRGETVEAMILVVALT